jgi:hypothetical protein
MIAATKNGNSRLEVVDTFEIPATPEAETGGLLF